VQIENPAASHELAVAPGQPFTIAELHGKRTNEVDVKFVLTR